MASRDRIVCWLILSTCVLACAAGGAAGESPAATAVTFRREPPQAGDVGAQSVASTMAMEVSVLLGQQVVHEDSTRVQRTQRRAVRLTEVEPGVRMAGRVTYEEAKQSVASGNQAAEEGETVQQPVVGKTYHVERDRGELRITAPDGKIPPQDEYEIVWHNMESFGKPNPLSEFLDGRTLAVGQTIELPTEAATQLLAFGDDVVHVERFSLTLQQVREEKGRPHAVFNAFVSSRSHGQSQMGMQVEGRLVVDARCRVVLLELGGPVGLTETRSEGADTYLISGRGKIRVAMHGSYERASQ